MNCIEARRYLLQSTDNIGTDLKDHLSQCKACSDFAAEIRHTENTILQALDVQAPKNLAEKILLRQQLKTSRKKPFMLAASIIIITSLTTGAWFVNRYYPPIIWSDVALQHVLNEPSALQSVKKISAHSLNQALEEFGLEVQVTLGEIRYLDKCDLPGGKGLHVVIDSTDHGKISLILPPPSVRAKSAPAIFDRGYVARMIPIGTQSIGLVTDHPGRSEAVSQWLQQAITTKAG